MKLWPLNNLYFIVFLVIGFLVTAPFVLGLMGEFWWLALPAAAAWAVVLWIWGLPFITSPAEAKTASIGAKAGAVAIMMGQTLVGGILATFLIRVLIDQWIATVLAVLIIAVMAFWAGREPPKRGARDGDLIGPAPERPAAALHLAPPPPATPLGWWRHHLSLVLFVALGVATVIDQIHRRTFAIGWLGLATTLAYAGFVWIHVVSPPKPGEAPPSLLMKVLMTFMTLAETLVGMVVAVLIAEAVGEFWIWIVPPAALVGLFVILSLHAAKPERAVSTAGATAHGGHKHRSGR